MGAIYAMIMNLVTAFDQQVGLKMKKHPDLHPGYTVRVHQRIIEGSKERVQVFDGLIIAIHKASQPNYTFTVRRIASGVGVEQVFTLHSPLIEKIEIKKKAKVRRNKLYYLRNLSGKSARLQETHVAVTTEEEPEVKAAKTAETAEEKVEPTQETTPEVAEATKTSVTAEPAAEK